LEEDETTNRDENTGRMIPFKMEEKNSQIKKREPLGFEMRRIKNFVTGIGSKNSSSLAGFSASKIAYIEISFVKKDFLCFFEFGSLFSRSDGSCGVQVFSS